MNLAEVARTRCRYHLTESSRTRTCVLCLVVPQDYPYREQSAPHFGVNKVARGGCFATPDLLLNTRGGEYRSFYSPSERRELCVGFRTCAL